MLYEDSIRRIRRLRHGTGGNGKAGLRRQGQTEKVIVHHLVVNGGRDEDVMAALEDKHATQEHLLQSLKARIEKIKTGGQK